MEIPTLDITPEHVVGGVYAGPDVSDWPGDIKITAGLGVVRFPGAVAARGHILSAPGSSVSVAEDIIAGRSIGIGEDLSAAGIILAGGGIVANGSVHANAGIGAGENISVGRSISGGGGGVKATGNIEAGGNIGAAWSVTAGGGIIAGWSVRAGKSVSAGGAINVLEGVWADSGGISAGLSINAKSVSAAAFISAGNATRRPLDPGEDEIRAEIRRGTVIHGTVVAPTATLEPNH